MAENEDINNTTEEETLETDYLNDSTKTLVEVGTDLSELLTNSVNMVDKFYEIFFDTTPHYVTLEMYDKEGVLQEYQIPNRAKDRSIALSGSGSPEGAVEGVIGDLYIDEVTRDLYIKKTSTGTDGWYDFSPESLTVFTKEYVYDSSTSLLKLHRTIDYPEHLMVFANGVLLTSSDVETDSVNTPDYDLTADKSSITFYTEIEDGAKILVRYLDGFGGLKGDTAISVTVGETNTLSPDEPASVVQTNVDADGTGNGQDVILDFNIPQGKTGNSGVYIGETEPTDSEQTIWIDTSSDGVSESDYAGMRIWDSGVASGVTTYNKIYDLKHSTFDSSKVTVSSGVNVDTDGVATNFTSATSKVTIPYKIGNFAKKDWFISLKCKCSKITSGEFPIITLSEGYRGFGAIIIRPSGFSFAARTGNAEDTSSTSNNEGYKITIAYELPSTPTLYQFDLKFEYDLGLYKFSVYDENGIEIEHAYWQAPEYIVKNGQRVDLHSRELYYITNSPTHNLTIGCFPADNASATKRTGDEAYYLQSLTILVENDTGKLEQVYITNETGSDTVTLPDGSDVTIAYNVSNTGSKIAGTEYKTAIETLYEKTGTGNYYILDEANKTYVMPMPDIYGMLVKMQTEIDALKNA